MPALSVDESYTKPMSMLYRNLLAMETEEQIRSHPLDGVVLMGSDKTTPSLVWVRSPRVDQPPAEARRELEQSEGSAPGALAQPETDNWQTQGRSV